DRLCAGIVGGSKTSIARSPPCAQRAVTRSTVRRPAASPPGTALSSRRPIDQLGTGDTFVVAEWDRVTRSMIDGIDIIKRINDRRCLLKVLDKAHLDLTTPIGRGFIAFLSAMAEDERLRILARCRGGLAAAKARGVKLGRKSKLTEVQRQEARRRLEAGESARSIGKLLGVHHATVLGA